MKPDIDFFRALLQQGPQLSPEEYATYRRKLRERLARAEREERLMRRMAFIVCGLAGVLWFVWGGFRLNDVQALSGAVWSVVLVASALVPVFAGYAVFLYFFKYRPRLRDAQQQEQRALLVDIQRQLDELRAQLSRPEA